jgi:Na+-driven multidrug efflux pump
MNKDLTAGSPGKNLLLYTLPLLGSVFFTQLYNIADSLVAGNFINENALAAVGNASEITLIYTAFAFGCNIGCSVVISQLFGSGRKRELQSCGRTCNNTLSKAVYDTLDYYISDRNECLL